MNNCRDSTLKLMSFFDNVSGDVSPEILEHSHIGGRYPYAQSIVYDKKRHMIMGKAKNELLVEGTQLGYFCSSLVRKRMAQERSKSEDSISPARTLVPGHCLQRHALLSHTQSSANLPRL